MSDAVSNEEFYARLGIKPPTKAKGIREVMADDALRVKRAEELIARLGLTAIQTSAKAL